MFSRTHRPPTWSIAAAIAVGFGVCFSVLLISVSEGVSDRIQSQLGNPAVSASGLLDVANVDRILTLLTVVVLAAMLFQTAAATFILGITTMHSRREEIALRRQSGVLRQRLLLEFAREMTLACLAGGLAGEALGVLIGLGLHTWTVLPISLGPVALVSSFPITVVIALAATLWPAWRAANASPALLRRSR